MKNKTPILYKATGQVVLFPGYIASPDGKVYSLSYNKTKQLKECTGSKDKDGYVRLCLHNSEGKKEYVSRARVIASTFLGAPDKKHNHINHISECKSDDSITNLEWCDAKYNNSFGTKNERAKAKLKEIPHTWCVKPVRVYKIVGTFGSLQEASEKIGIPVAEISAAITQKRLVHQELLFEELSV